MQFQKKYLEIEKLLSKLMLTDKERKCKAATMIRIGKRRYEVKLQFNVKNVV